MYVVASAPQPETDSVPSPVGLVLHVLSGNFESSRQPAVTSSSCRPP